MNKIFSILVVLSVVLFSFSYAAIVPIDNALKALDATGVPVNVSSGPYEVVGVVTNINGSLDPTSFLVYIQDTGTGLGFQVYQSGGVAGNPSYAQGDLMNVTGNLANYNGIVEFVPSSPPTIKLGSGYGFATVVAYSGISSVSFFDQTALSGGELVDGRVFRLDNVTIVGGTWPGAGANANILISDFSGATITMRIDKDTLIPNNRTSAPTGSFTVIGIGGQFDATSPYTQGDDAYQITPRAYTDIIDGTSISRTDNFKYDVFARDSTVYRYRAYHHNSNFR